MVIDSRCRHLYALSDELVWASLKSCALASSPKGRPIFSGEGHGGVIGSYIARIGKSTDVSFTTR